MRVTLRVGVRAAILLLVVSMLAGCGQTQQPAAPKPAPAPAPAAPANQLVMGKVLDAETLDPHGSAGVASREIYNMLYDRLVYIDTQGVPQPWLAESWTVSKDGKELVFKLVKDRKFTDGTPVDAKAVKYTFDRMLEPQRAASAATQFSEISKVEVVDDYTVRFLMKNPYPPIFNSLATPFGGIISPTAAEKLGKDFGRNPVGSGPFKFEKWTAGTEISFVKNPDYKTVRKDVTNKGPALVDRIVIKVVSEANTRLSAVQTGAVHVGLVSFAQTDTLKKDPNIRLEALAKGFNINYIEFNQRKAPFDDVRVRKAVAYAVNPQENITAVYFGNATRSKVLLPTGVAGHNDAIGQQYGYDYSKDKAKQLLDQAGWIDTDKDGIREKGGKKLDVEILGWIGTETDRSTQILQAQLADVGIKVRINLMEAGTFLVKGKDGVQNFDWMRTTWAEPLILSRCLSGGGTFKNFDNKAFEALLTDASSQMDWDKRKTALDKAERMILEQALAIPMFTDHYIYMVRNEVKNWKWDSLGWELLNDVTVVKK